MKITDTTTNTNVCNNTAFPKVASTVGFAERIHRVREKVSDHWGACRYGVPSLHSQSRTIWSQIHPAYETLTSP